MMGNSLLGAASVPVPLLIFVAEMVVVTLGTIRTIFVARGMKYLAPLLGFFEVLIWLFAISRIMSHLNQVDYFLAFAAGFAMGNYLGICIEKKLAIGSLVVRIITPRDPAALVRELRLAHFGVTCVEGQGATGPVTVIFTVIKRRELSRVVGLIETFHPQAFYSVEELHSTASGIFPAARRRRAIFPPALELFRVGGPPPVFEGSESGPGVEVSKQPSLAGPAVESRPLETPPEPDQSLPRRSAA
jgi:uncharacterized protein YebE (UPF0316 family)